MASIPEESNPGRPPAKRMPMPIIFSGEKKDLEECLGYTKRKRPNAPIAANHADTPRNVRGTRGGEIFNSLLQNLWVLGRLQSRFALLFPVKGKSPTLEQGYIKGLIEDE